MINSTNVAAVVLTFNEEINIQRCLEHLQWADEIIVVDSGSTDQTCALARKAGARVIPRQAGKFIIADQRNWALVNADINAEWVFFVDADEIVTVELRDELISIVNTVGENITAFRLCPKFMFMGRWLKHTVDFPVWHDRLLRLGKTCYVGEVWEYFETNGDIGYIKEPYLHYALNNGISSWLQRHQRYAEWKAGDMLDPNVGGKPKVKTTKDQGPGETKRSIYRFLERAGTRLGFFSPILRFFHYYFVRLGFLDGLPGLVYAMMMSCYQFMICLFVLEKREKAKGRSL